MVFVYSICVVDMPRLSLFKNTWNCMDVWISYLKTALAEEKTKPFKHNEKNDSLEERTEAHMFVFRYILNSQQPTVWSELA